MVRAPAPDPSQDLPARGPLRHAPRRPLRPQPVPRARRRDGVPRQRRRIADPRRGGGADGGLPADEQRAARRDLRGVAGGGRARRRGAVGDGSPDPRAVGRRGGDGIVDHRPAQAPRAFGGRDAARGRRDRRLSIGPREPYRPMGRAGGARRPRAVVERRPGVPEAPPRRSRRAPVATHTSRLLPPRVEYPRHGPADRRDCEARPRGRGVARRGRRRRGAPPSRRRPVARRRLLRLLDLQGVRSALRRPVRPPVVPRRAARRVPLLPRIGVGAGPLRAGQRQLRSGLRLRRHRRLPGGPRRAIRSCRARPDRRGVRRDRGARGGAGGTPARLAGGRGRRSGSSGRTA